MSPVESQAWATTEIDRQYRLILASILPRSMLSDAGYLKTPTGESEAVKFIGPAPRIRCPTRRSSFAALPRFLTSLLCGFLRKPPATVSSRQGYSYYQGALQIKALRHRLEQSKHRLPSEEYTALKTFLERHMGVIGNCDTISILNPTHASVLVHEAFHDIQGYLYDHHPKIVDDLFAALESHKHAITDWYTDSANKAWTGPRQYRLEHFFPTVNTISPYSAELITAAYTAVAKVISRPSEQFFAVLGRGHQDCGRNEAVPVLLSAAAVGNETATRIVSEIFASAGLNADFHRTLPRYD